MVAFVQRLALLSREEILRFYLDDVAVRLPTWDVPGEATAMLEIMHKICMSVGYPWIPLDELAINRKLLVPLINGARWTSRRFDTALEYDHYDKVGSLIDEEHFRPEKRNAAE